MALTYTESANLMNDPVFRGRVKVAALNYAQAISIQANNSGSKIRWAQNTFASPDSVAAQLVNPVVMDPQVQTDGSAITDTNLQTSVQVVADRMM